MHQRLYLMIEVSTCTEESILPEKKAETFDPRFERISDGSDNPMMDALNSQSYSSSREELVKRAHAIAKLYDKRSTATQTLQMSFMHDKATLKKIAAEVATCTSSVGITQTYSLNKFP